MSPADRRRRRGVRALIAMNANGWLVASLSTIGVVCFIPALQLTNVANVAIYSSGSVVNSSG